MYIKTTILTIIFAGTLFFSACDMPSERDNLDGKMPAVSAYFAPGTAPSFSLFYVVPIDEAFHWEDMSYTAITDASVVLSGADGAITFAEDSYNLWEYTSSDSDFIEPNGRYLLTVDTDVGAFSESLFVPDNIGVTYGFSDTVIFDNTREYAKDVAWAAVPGAYAYEVFIDSDILWEPDARALPDSVTSGYYDELFVVASNNDAYGVRLPWALFWVEGRYKIHIRVYDKALFEYRYNELYRDDDYLVPGGDGYVGVVGSFVDYVDSFYLIID